MEKVNRVESCFAIDKFHKMKSKEDEAVKKFIIDDFSKRVAEYLADILSSEAQPERKAPISYKEQLSLDCDFCRQHECGDTLYESSDWDGGIGFDYIRNIRFCPICGRKLYGDE